MRWLRADGDRVVVRAASPTVAAAIGELDPATGAWTVLRAIDDGRGFRPVRTSRCRGPSSSRRPAGRPHSGSSFRRTTRSSSARRTSVPPLIVTSHGGPTASPTRRFRSASSCSRAAGSPSSTSTTAEHRLRPGLSKAPRGPMGRRRSRRLRQRRALARRRGARRRRTARRSAAAARAATRRSARSPSATTFGAGTSYFGIGDLETFVSPDPQVRIALSRPADRAIPGAQGPYHDRSPLNFAGPDLVPVLILQGAEDRIVPPAQAEQIVDALWEKRPCRMPTCCSRARITASVPQSTIVRAFEAELSFYGQIFGFRARRPDRADRRRVPRARLSAEIPRGTPPNRFVKYESPPIAPSAASCQVWIAW